MTCGASTGRWRHSLPAPAVQLKAAWDHLAYQLRLHHEDEEAYFGPALRELGADEALVGDLHGEHVVMLQALQSADVAVATFAGDASADNAAAARDAVARLDTVVDEHLVHEERASSSSPPPIGAHPR